MNNIFKLYLFCFRVGPAAWAEAWACDKVTEPGQGYGDMVKHRGKRRPQRWQAAGRRVSPAIPGGGD